MNEEIISANLKSLRKHRLQIQQERIGVANDAARAIVELIEEETGSELSLNTSMKIFNLISLAQV